MSETNILKASILIVGHPSAKLVEFGADTAADYVSALQEFRKNAYAVVVAPETNQNASCLEMFREMRSVSPLSQFVLVSKNANLNELQTLVNSIGLFKTISDFSSKNLTLAVQEALEEFELVRQNKAFFDLRTEQNKKLILLTQELEERVRVRESYLVESKNSLTQSTKKLEALHRALVAIQRSLHTHEMENHLNNALRGALDLAWTRIVINDQEGTSRALLTENPMEKNIFATPLLRGKQVLGHIYFAHKFQDSFGPEEEDFLLQVSDAVGLTVDRLLAIESIESLKQEWDSTFDAITNPVSMVTEDFTIVRANKAYAHAAQLTEVQITGKKCHQVLFGLESPCPNCRLGEKFQVKTGEQQYTVSSQKIFFEGEKEAYAVFYRDVSEEEKIQRQILESSKMAEIGTIGSSIAHEINNPLGGIIAFVQMIKSELKSNAPHRDDILEMERAALKCKTIVENLLSFARKSEATEYKLIQISDIIDSALSIIEIQTRSQGILLTKGAMPQNSLVSGSVNQLVQVLVSVLQNSVDSLVQRLNTGQRVPEPEIKIVTRTKGSDLLIEVQDNGLGIRPENIARIFTPFYSTKDKTKHTGLGLSVSYQIVKDHKGSMEIFSQLGKSTSTVISLPLIKS